MFIAFDSSSSSPIKLGSVGEGEVVVQVLNGVGVWIGKSEQGLLQARGPGLYDGFLVQAGDGIIRIPWSGDIWVNWPDRTSDVFAQIDYMGCR